MSRYASKIMIGQWILIAVMSVTMFVGYREFVALVDCVNETAAGQRARAEANELNDRAVDDMVLAFLASKTPEDARAALEQYRKTREEVDKIRRENPVVTPDRC